MESIETTLRMVSSMVAMLLDHDEKISFIKVLTCIKLSTCRDEVYHILCVYYERWVPVFTQKHDTWTFNLRQFDGYCYRCMTKVTIYFLLARMIPFPKISFKVQPKKEINVTLLNAWSINVLAIDNRNFYHFVLCFSQELICTIVYQQHQIGLFLFVL
jgi:hypothetical protein